MTYQGTQSTTGALNLSVKATSPATATFTLQSTDGKKFFIKGNGLENTPKLFSSDSTLAPLAHAKTDQWYGIDHNPLASSMKNSLDFWQLRFQGNDIKKYRDAYNSHRFLIVQQVLSPQKLANQQSMHYKVSIDSQRFNAFVKAYTASKPSNTDTLARLRNIHIEGKPFEVWIAAKNKTDVIIQLATPHIHGQSYTKLTPVAPSTAAVKEPRDTKTLAELQKDYDDEIAAQQAAKAAAAATSSSSSKKNVSSTPGFDTWAQEYNFQNYVLPNLW
jgi:uncharacterized protein YeaO (DUF488 family)